MSCSYKRFVVLFSESPILYVSSPHLVTFIFIFPDIYVILKIGTEALC